MAQIPKPFLKSSMKQQFNNKIFVLLVLALTITLLLGLETGKTAEQAGASSEGGKATAPASIVEKNTPPYAAGVSSTGQPVADDITKGATGVQPDEAAEILAMKQRYCQDATGARARLGLCGKGKGGPGCGQHRRFRGGNRWNTPQ